MNGKMVIILIDDAPTYFLQPMDSKPDFSDVVLDPPFEPYFHVYWIKNAYEAREFLAAFDLLAHHDAEAVGQLGLPAGIVLFDYALTSGGKQKRHRDQPSHLLPHLRDALKKAELSLDLPDDSGVEGIIFGPHTGAPRGKDRTGCYVGVSLARAFGSFPCGAVPTTAHITDEELERTDAKFFEWLHGEYLFNLFNEKSRVSPTWNELLGVGVKAFRQRVVQLAGTGLIRVSLTDLECLVEKPNADEELRIFSRYGERSLPLKAVFADLLLCEPRNEAAFAAAAGDWAKAVLGAIFRGCSKSEFDDARTLANLYANAAVKGERGMRDELTNLVLAASRAPEEEDQLDALCDHFGVNRAAARAAKSPRDVRIVKKGLLPHWREQAEREGRSQEVARWAALMLLVHAEQYARCAAEDALKDLFGREPKREDFGVGPYTRKEWEEEFSKEEVRRAIREKGLVRRNDGLFHVPDSRSATPNDLHELLDPFPEGLVTSDSDRSANVNRNLHRLGKVRKRGRASKDDKDDKDDNYGPLGLEIAEVLNGGPFNPAADQYGLRRHEKRLLQLYADELGFPSKRWPTWLA